MHKVRGGHKITRSWNADSGFCRDARRGVENLRFGQDGTLPGPREISCLVVSFASPPTPQSAGFAPSHWPGPKALLYRCREGLFICSADHRIASPIGPRGPSFRFLYFRCSAQFVQGRGLHQKSTPGTNSKARSWVLCVFCAGRRKIKR